MCLTRVRAPTAQVRTGQPEATVMEEERSLTVRGPEAVDNAAFRPARNALITDKDHVRCEGFTRRGGLIDKACKRYSNFLSGGASRRITLRNDKLIPPTSELAYLVRSLIRLFPPPPPPLRSDAVPGRGRGPKNATDRTKTAHRGRLGGHRFGRRKARPVCHGKLPATRVPRRSRLHPGWMAALRPTPNRACPRWGRDLRAPERPKEVLTNQL